MYSANETICYVEYAVGGDQQVKYKYKNVIYLSRHLEAVISCIYLVQVVLELRDAFCI